MTIEVENISMSPVRWNELVQSIPTLAEERWRIVDEGDEWVVWFIPLHHPERWRELARFRSQDAAEAYVQRY